MKLLPMSPIVFVQKVKRKLHGENISPHWIKPFAIQDLALVPLNWKVGMPDYIGIGTSKAGTSWWHHLILAHPQVQENRLNYKELDYFTHFLYSGLKPNDIATYRQAFAVPLGSICGEFTPGYLRTPLVAEYIHATAPDAKLVVILRNPIDQMRSAINQLMRTAQYYNLRGARKKVFYNTTAVPDAITFNLVFPALQRYLKFFDRSQLLVLQYEKCVENPQMEIRKTYNFLGIDADFRPPNLNEKVNKVNYSIPKISASQRQYFAEFYWDDVHATADLFQEIDLSLWADFYR